MLKFISIQSIQISLSKSFGIIYLRNSANFDILYTSYCKLGQFTRIIHEADHKKRKLSHIILNRIQNVKIGFIPCNLIH
jgi:hypothetical protein